MIPSHEFPKFSEWMEESNHACAFPINLQSLPASWIGTKELGPLRVQFIKYHMNIEWYISALWKEMPMDLIPPPPIAVGGIPPIISFRDWYGESCPSLFSCLLFLVGEVLTTTWLIRPSLSVMPGMLQQHASPMKYINTSAHFYMLWAFCTAIYKLSEWEATWKVSPVFLQTPYLVFTP